MTEELRKVLASKITALEEKENAVFATLNAYVSRGDYTSVADTIVELKDMWQDLTTARVTKIIKAFFETIPYCEESFEAILNLLERLITWADSEGKKMLRLDLQCKRIYALLKTGKYVDTIDQVGEVMRELKKYDDKVNLITLHVYESKALYELKNISKSRACLTSARVLAVSAYCPSHLQAQIDLLSGMYICDERNYGVASSYFIEALEGFTLGKLDAEACVALRYLILSKIMANKCDEVAVVLRNKSTMNHLDDRTVKTLLNISIACKDRDLKTYSDVLVTNSDVIGQDAFIYAHMQYLYDALLEKNIVKIVEPYSVVRIDFIARMLCFDVDVIEKKLRKMILDKMVCGTLDHINQSLILHEVKPLHGFAEDCARHIEALNLIASTKY
ncbi:26S proteasome regulatory subunit rpn6 [Ordospora colligata]|uniref:26S proteasome regulatory complex protein n=1 Tax=Ordospora colligata OC4 TaxID=1354746 RepID=A0A0B2UE26_9MICR|nr:26S proteasome regulatory complex protein [Ordospora colligata OC4]KHN69321.1 26S proteasome regulatory complex protein [Ordospora colligata OC4]TBU14835.1 26S proteasome regulatory complex protein [Ordospora colligata]TBU14966.1 26S proteasome regulatory complex protein [Ordospora colligata]